MPKPRVMRLLQGYYWDNRNRNYVRAATGRFVARGRVVELLEKSVAGRERRLYEGVRRLVDGTRSPQVFLSHAKVMLKRQYLQEAALAAGGWDQLTPADFGGIGGKLRGQYRRLSELTQGIRDGEVSEAQALNRMQMYMGNARAEYFEVERERLPVVPQGKTRIEQRRLGAKDKGNCEDCLRYADMGWRPEGELPVPGQGSVCMPGNSLVRANTILRAFKREYIGELVEITTALGHKLTATPNHPVATPTGWVAIGALHESDQIIYDRKIQRMAGSYPDVVDVPTPIGDIYDALAVIEGVKRMPSLPMDFHGDGRKQEIYVVWADHRLPDGVEAPCCEGVLDLLFSPASGTEVSATCLVSSRTLSSHVDGLEFLWMAQGDFLLGENPFEGMGGRFVPSAYCPHGVARSVGIGNLFARQAGNPGGRAGFVDDHRLAIATARYASIAQTRMDSGSADSIPTRERQLGFSGDIPPSDLINGQGYPWPSPFLGVTSIVSIRRFHFSGHVYNLTTGCHYYTTDGIIVQNCDGNCRCDLRRVVVDAERATAAMGTKGRP